MSGAATVTVACKMPHGLVLRLFDMVDTPDPQRDGTTKLVKQAKPRLDRVVIKGYAEKYDPSIPPAARGSAFALTHGVDKEFFDEWLRQNKDLDAVKNGLIFASEKRDDAAAKAKEMGKQLCGLEPISRDRLPRNIQTFKKDAA